MSHAYLIKPFRLNELHEWEFARYSESRSEREDGNNFSALIFRNKSKEIYGIIEFGENGIQEKRLRTIATKIVQDQAYRQPLIGKKENLEWMWEGF